MELKSDHLMDKSFFGGDENTLEINRGDGFTL